jgi:hypothetical protein
VTEMREVFPEGDLFALVHDLNYLPNSTNVARRIQKLYRRPARVIYPPVDIERYR